MAGDLGWREGCSPLAGYSFGSASNRSSGSSGGCKSWAEQGPVWTTSNMLLDRVLRVMSSNPNPTTSNMLLDWVLMVISLNPFWSSSFWYALLSRRQNKENPKVWRCAAASPPLPLVFWGAVPTHGLNQTCSFSVENNYLLCHKFIKLK